jgi:hypothetical protein
MHVRFSFAVFALTACMIFVEGPLSAQVPFDFSDEFYIQNGIDPAKFNSRVKPEDANATLDTSPDSKHSDTRILEVNGGFDSAGQLLYYPAPPATFSADAFLPNAAGQRARKIANEFRAFIFPLRNGDPTGPPVFNRRHDNMFDTSSGYLTDNPLGLWRVTFPRYTDKALFPKWDPKLEELALRNGLDLDGTPIIKRLSEIFELESLGLVDLIQRPEDGSAGFPWVV